MPIYEFYCTKCNTIFSFLSRKVNTKDIPDCPKCKGQKLQKEISPFAMTGKAKEGGGMDELPIDETKMEKAMESLASETQGIDENDPRQAAQLMRKFSKMTGLEFSGGMEEAMKRLESGENPEAIEADMEKMMSGDENPFVIPGQKGKKIRLPPKRDSKMYEM